MRPVISSLLLLFISKSLVASEYLMGGHLDNTETTESFLARIADDLDFDLTEKDTVSSDASSSNENSHYRLPFPFAFNGGKPFSLEKDPISGKIDYEKVPPLKVLNYTNDYNEYLDEDESKAADSPLNYTDIAKDKTISSKANDISPNDINPYSPGFHDFLNLPVHYSSDKYGKNKYPLISSSYANTKVQGGSGGSSTYNHKPYHREPSNNLYYTTQKIQHHRVTSTPGTTAKIETKATTPSTTTTTTTTTTMKPATTQKPTTARPTTSFTKMAPKVSASTLANRQTEYEDILPIEALQASQHEKNHQGTNNVMPSTPSQEDPSMEDYEDGYEEYGMHEDMFDYSRPVKNSSKAPVRLTSAKPTVPSVATSSSTSKPMTSTLRSSSSSSSTWTSTSPLPPSSSTTYTPSPSPSSSTTSYSTTSAGTATRNTVNERENGKPFATQPPVIFNRPVSQHPVTSMPLGFPYKVRDNTVDHVKPEIIGGSNQGSPLGYGGIHVASTSNILVPPGQDTMSFVLGNQQNVVGNGYYGHGTVTGENAYGTVITDGSFRPMHAVGSVDTVKGNEQQHHGSPQIPSLTIPDSEPQKWWPPGPSGLAHKVTVNEIVDVSTPTSAPTQSLDAPKNQDAVKPQENGSDYVVFPSNEETRQPIEEHVFIINEADSTIHEVVPSTTVKAHAQEESNLPQLSEDLTPPRQNPPAVVQRPPHYYQYQHHPGSLRPDMNLRPQRLPRPERPVSFKRRPGSEVMLPNILPQFRPNAKTSHGHRGVETIGTLPAGGSRRPPQSPARRPPPSQFLQKLNPQPPTHALPPIQALRLTAPAPIPKIPENISVKSEPVTLFRPPPESARPEDRIRYSPAKLRQEDEKEQYSEEPPQLPPRPVLFPKNRAPGHLASRVATLQMIQMYGNPEDKDPEDSPVEETEHSADRRKDEESGDEPLEAPVYVVYPVNSAVNIHQDDSGDKDESVVIGIHGPNRPLPPDTLPQDDESDENGDNDRPEHGALHIGVSYPDQPIASNFPYPLERPDPSIFMVREKPLLVPSEIKRQPEKEDEDEESVSGPEKDTSMNVIPYLQDYVPFSANKKGEIISATLRKVSTSTPIAYVYTPTTEVPILNHLQHHHKLEEQQDRKPVLLPAQQPSSSSSSAPSPQNFMAPFIASVSAEVPAKNGWSVVSVEPNVADKRNSNEEEITDTGSENTQTEKSDFDVENFKPQLFGGFKPIYEFPTADEEVTEAHDTAEIKPDMPRSL